MKQAQNTIGLVAVAGGTEGTEAGSSRSCKNLHADDDTLKPLTACAKELIAALSLSAQGEPFFDSCTSSVPSPIHARRGPSRAKRRAWHAKSKYQRSRCPERLRPWQVEGLFEADRFARKLGLPLNAFLTISWNHTAPDAHAIRERFQGALKSIGEWLRRRGILATWIYTHENPGNVRPHFHMLIHLPATLHQDFESMCANWFDALDGAVHLRRRNGPRDRCLSYMVKGTDWVTARRHGARATRQGMVSFKRAGTSQNLGATARCQFSGGS